MAGLNVFIASLSTQGVGGLILVMICCALYLHRRRSYFLYWTLSWLCFSLGMLLRAEAFKAGPLPVEAASGWFVLAHVAVWQHAALWGLGLWVFHRGRAAPPGGAFPARYAAPFLAAATVGALAASLLPWPLHNFLLSTALAAVYGGSALGLLRGWRARRPIGRPILAAALALSALAQADAARIFLIMYRYGAVWSPPFFAPFVDFLLQTFIAVGMILLLLGDEETLLQETLRRLAESEDRFRILCEHGGVGLALLSAEGLIVQANPALEEMLGYGPGQLLGVRLSDLSHPEDRGDDTHRMRRQSPGEGREQIEREKRYLRKDGDLVWARVVRAVVRDEGGTVRYHASVLMDVTERRRAEDALRQAEDVLRQERDFVSVMLQAADALVLVTDRAGRVVRFNNKCVAVSGYTEEEARGRVFWEFLLPERCVALVRDEFAHMVGPGAPPPRANPSEVPWRTREGGERRIAWRQSVVRDDEDGVRFVIAVGLDVTEQRRLEAQVRQAQKLETLATLVGGIAHDFNNQLTAVIGNLNLVLEDLRAADDGGAVVEEDFLRNLRFWAESAEVAAQGCAAMTNRLLTFSRGRIGARQALRLNQLLPEAVRLLRSELPDSIHIEVQAPDDVWPISGDWAPLHQVVFTLAVNARDAMPNGGTLTLALANRIADAEQCALELDARPGRFVELLVRDDGAGMTAEVRARLFEPFFTTKPTGEGVGLGLAEVYGVLKAHQGWIKVETEPGRGTTFHLYLPAAVEAEPAAAAAPAQGQAHGGDACVLVVDDENMVRDLARLVLTRRGFRVLTAADGEEGLAQYGAHRGEIDLVLLDYSMPGLTGLQVFEALRKLDPGVCVLFSSGFALEGDASPLLAAGASGFVAKPYRPDELVQAVRKALGEKAAQETALNRDP